MALTTVQQGLIGTPVAGNGPAFSAYLNTTQTLSNNTFTAISFETKQFDTATAYSTSTYRFTPNVAGYYQINATLQFQANASGVVVNSLYKNGSRYYNLVLNTNSVSGNLVQTSSILVYLNGTTDYLQVYGFQSSGGNLVVYGQADGGSTVFSGTLVRAA